MQKMRQELLGREWAADNAIRSNGQGPRVPPAGLEEPGFTLETKMKTQFLALCVFASLALAAGTANAKGCLEGAAVGGVAGHVAGHHTVAGAAIGCAVGHHRAKVKAKEAAQANAAPNSAARSTPPNTDVAPAAK
jgi:hypothetical protein